MAASTIDPMEVKAEPHERIGSIIQRDVAPIVQRWAERALEEQPEAKRLHHAALQNDLPLLLWEMGRVLIETDPEQITRHHLPATNHGEQRWEVGWSIAELIRDYQILRLVLVDYLEQAARRVLTSREVMAIGVILDEAISVSVTNYLRSLEVEGNPADQRSSGTAAEPERPIDDPLSVLAHEARNSLAPIKQALAALQRMHADPTAIAWATNLIDRQVSQLARLVDDLLDTARIRSGSLSLRRERVELTRLLRATALDHRRSFEIRGIRFSVHMPAREVYCDVDPARIAQVLNNLLHNALKCTSVGGAVEVTGEVRHDLRSFVTRVRDTGIGMDAETLASIFDRSKPGGQEDRIDHDGLGLGLLLVKGLVECHGGEITARSDGVGQGAVFEFRLPLIQTLPDEETRGDEALSHARPRPLKILVIDDHVDSAHSLLVLLGTIGHDARVANSGEEGLKVAREWSPEVVLCDIGLPGMSGEETAERLRAASAHPPYLIAISGYGSADHRRSAADAGFDHYLVKPIDFDQLERCLAEALRN